MSDDLASFLEVVVKVAGSIDGSAGGSLTSAREAIAASGLLDLGRDTADETDALAWVAHTLRVSAMHSPSLAFALASRYAGDRLTVAEPAATGAAFALASQVARAVVPTAFAFERLVVLDTDAHAVRAYPWPSGQQSTPRRSGLAAADPVTVSPHGDASELTADPAQVLNEWQLFTSAALAGASRRALEATATYVMERHQFGVPVGTFAGLRALVATMAAKVEGVEAQIEEVLGGHRDGSGLASTAGRVASEVCLDAIQAHGGYGYIDEYPLAGLLRDSISLASRAGGRRLHVAAHAAGLLGHPSPVRP